MMSIRRLARVSQSLLPFSRFGQLSIIPTRSQVSKAQDGPDIKMFITPEERLRMLDERIYELGELVDELIAQDAYPDEDFRDYVAELRHSREARDEIVHLMRELSRLQITEQGPNDYEQWIPWAHEKTAPRAPKEATDGEPNYFEPQRWRKAKEAFRELGRVPSSLRFPQKHRRKSRAPIWLLRIVLRRFSCVISLGRNRDGQRYSRRRDSAKHSRPH
jgi:hypothetical protein